MARTRASVGAKVSAGKSSKARCCAAPAVKTTNSSGSSERGSRSYSGGNPVCPRETPQWQKPITTFFISKEPTRGDDNGEAARPDSDDEPASTSRPRRNVIVSDDEEDPASAELNESLPLEPLNGEECHKIEEYYPANEKGKGIGKKTKINENGETVVQSKRNSTKRELRDSDEEVESASKKIKTK